MSGRISTTAILRRLHGACVCLHPRSEALGACYQSLDLCLELGHLLAASHQVGDLFTALRPWSL
jgi:hypothetical protein